MSASLLKFEVERTGEGWWGGVAWVCTGPVITMVRCLRQPDNNPLNRIGDAVATVKIPLANVRKINILFDHREPKQKIKTSSRPHMVTRPGATYKKFEDGWPSHLADRHY